MRRFLFLLGIILVVSKTPVYAYSPVAGFPDNPNEMDTFPYSAQTTQLFTYTVEEYEDMDMQELEFLVRLSANEEIYNWMEPVYLTATITGEDLNVFPYLRWRVQGLGTIADEGSIVISNGVGVSTARQILPNPYITHLVFYLYFPSGQVHMSTHPIEIGNRPITSGASIDSEGKGYVTLPKTNDPLTKSLTSLFVLGASGTVFIVTLKNRKVQRND